MARRRGREHIGHDKIDALPEDLLQAHLNVAEIEEVQRPAKLDQEYQHHRPLRASSRATDPNSE